ncbi:MAG: hypothetical protein RMZ69_21810 [Nostoc sp. ChiQUE01a]|nr:hypothetical protein [Nostoc sp. ChiQUE01a]
MTFEYIAQAVRVSVVPARVFAFPVRASALTFKYIAQPARASAFPVRASALTFKYIAQPARASAFPVKASALTRWQTALCYQEGEKGERAQIKNFSPQGIEQVFLNIENKKKKIFKTRSAIKISVYI